MRWVLMISSDCTKHRVRHSSSFAASYFHCVGMKYHRAYALDLLEIQKYPPTCFEIVISLADR